MLLVGAVAAAGVPALILVVVPFSTIALSLFPLIWSGGSLVWGRGAVVLVLCASALVPCAILFVAIALYRELGSALREEGGGRTP